MTNHYPVLIIIIFCTSCNSLWGDHRLGKNISLLEGDRREDRIIVYCPHEDVEVCNSGVYLVPTYERHMDNGRYAEYVEEAKSNKRWVIARSVRVKDKSENYWIIRNSIKNLDCEKLNCDSILQSHVTGPLTLKEFIDRKKALNIDLRF
jgi:hypothetical protein